MLNVRGNYSSQYKTEGDFCQSCLDKSTKETQPHILLCPSLSSNEITQTQPNYDDLFHLDMEKQIYISRMLKSRILRRTTIINNRS